MNNPFTDTETVTVTVTVSHSNGSPDDTHDDLADAIAALRAEYGAAVVIYDAGGWEVPDSGDGADYRGTALLVWRDEESSVDDAGGRTVAAIRRG